MSNSVPPRPGRPRLRELGHRIGRIDPGPLNAITDVAGVRVGHATVFDTAWGVYSGVTAIVPTALQGVRSLSAGLHVANGYGKFVGATQLVELGELETPVLLTSTLSTFRVADALVSWVLDHADGPVKSLNPVVGEVNDSWLSSTVARPVTADHVFTALAEADTGPVAMGNVGGGTGACALGFKAGIGTASRRIDIDGRAATVGALVQANMDGCLRFPGRIVTPESLGLAGAGPDSAQGSCVVVLAVDFACPAAQLSRVAARGVFALGRVGAAFSHGSGDYGLAFSTDTTTARNLEPAELDAVFAAVMDCVEESVIDALLAAETVTAPSGRVAHALPHRTVRV
ncbi:P1 family peptidase [Embleya sp. NPDC050154]|uniref:P1 family peptidase n=1 Tax=unclassified Embleya TaxID=2699296 RepID=UPI0037BC737E